MRAMSDNQSSKNNCKWLKIVALVLAGLFGVGALIVLVAAVMMSFESELSETYKNYFLWYLLFGAEITKFNLWMFGSIHLLLAAACGLGFIYVGKRCE